MKPRGKPIYSINEGNACLFDDAVTKYLESIKFPKVNRLESILYFDGRLVIDYKINSPSFTYSVEQLSHGSCVMHD